MLITDSPYYRISLFTDSPFHRFSILQTSNLTDSSFYRFPIWQIPPFTNSLFDRFAIWQILHFTNSLFYRFSILQITLFIDSLLFQFPIVIPYFTEATWQQLMINNKNTQPKTGFPFPTFALIHHGLEKDSLLVKMIIKMLQTTTLGVRYSTYIQCKEHLYNNLLCVFVTHSKAMNTLTY